MNILIIAATKLEINNLLSKINCNTQRNIKFGTHNIDILTTGVGLVFTTYHLSKFLAAKHYDLCVNIGIAGSFNRNLEIGELVNVVQDEFADLGAERADGLHTIFDLGFAKADEFPFTFAKLINKPLNYPCLDGIKTVTAISSNTAHAHESSINQFYRKYKADIETMEGAAFFYVCMSENIKCLQIRAISNYMEVNNRDSWNIPLAITNLNNFIFDFLTKI